MSQLINFKVPILIYQMGKVASISIEQALRNAPLSHSGQILRTHFISDKFVHRLYAQIERNKLPESTVLSIQKQIQDAKKAQHVLASNRVKIITGVREPCSHAIASFFQNLQRNVEGHLDEEWKPLKSGKIQDDLMEAIYRGWQERTKQIACDPTNAISWFDYEFGPVTGIDIYKYPFDHDKGYLILRSGRIDLLVYKLENGSENIERALSEFFNIPDVLLKRENAGIDKPYSSYYKKFINTINVPSDFLNLLYDSKYVKHFYTPKEVTAFRQKWEKS